MNRSLLILVCDFLLVSMLSLASFDKPSDVDSRRGEQARPAPAEGPTAEELARADLAASLVEALATLQQEQAELASELATKDAQLGSREADLEATRERLARSEREAAELAATRERLLEERGRLGEAVAAAESALGAAREDAAVARERLRGTEERLREREAELAANRERLEAAAEERRRLEAARAEAEREVAIREAQRAILEQNLVEAEARVAIANEEKEALARRTDALATRVGELATTTSAVEERIRESTPVSANLTFDRWRRQQAAVEFEATGTGVLGARSRTWSAPAQVVVDRGTAWLVLHAAQTPFRPSATGTGWDRVTARIRAAGTGWPVAEIALLPADPRLLAVRVPAEAAPLLGTEPFALATDPLRFPQAVLVSPGTGYYGELSFRIEQASPAYLRMDNRLVTRLFGEFSPREGDVVFTQGAEFLGLMVSDTHAVTLPRVEAVTRLPLGDAYERSRADLLVSALARRLESLPAPLR